MKLLEFSLNALSSSSQTNFGLIESIIIPKLQINRIAKKLIIRKINAVDTFNPITK